MVDASQYDKGYYENDRLGGYSGYLQEAEGNLKKYFNDIKTYLESFFGDRKLRILDIGCAYGRMVQMLREEGHDVVGIDISEWAISQDVSGHCQVYDGLNIPFDDDEFDVVIALDCFEHVPTEDAEALIPEVRRVLKKENMCYFAIGYGQWENDKTHMNCDEKWWVRMFDKERFLLMDKGIMSGEVYVCE